MKTKTRNYIELVQDFAKAIRVTKQIKWFTRESHVIVKEGLAKNDAPRDTVYRLIGKIVDLKRKHS